jgi:hypothetical protein
MIEGDVALHHQGFESGGAEFPGTIAAGETSPVIDPEFRFHDHGTRKGRRFKDHDGRNVVGRMYVNGAPV